MTDHADVEDCEQQHADSELSQPPPPRPSGRCGRCSWLLAFKSFIVLVGLATIGVGAWGLATSFEHTQQISAFWNLVSTVEAKIELTVTTLQAMQSDLAEIQDAAAMLRSNFTRKGLKTCLCIHTGNSMSCCLWEED